MTEEGTGEATSVRLHQSLFGSLGLTKMDTLYVAVISQHRASIIRLSRPLSTYLPLLAFWNRLSEQAKFASLGVSNITYLTDEVCLFGRRQT